MRHAAYLQPDEGSVTIDGLDVLTHALEVQARIGDLPEVEPFINARTETFLAPATPTP